MTRSFSGLQSFMRPGGGSGRLSMPSVLNLVGQLYAGAGKPLLEKSRPPEATQISRGKQRQRAASFQLPSTKPSHMQPMLHALSARNATPNPRANSRVQHPTPQPARPVQGQCLLQCTYGRCACMMNIHALNRKIEPLLSVS